jgi:deoxyadenosine/deoxycytidine kinase
MVRTWAAIEVLNDGSRPRTGVGGTAHGAAWAKGAEMDRGAEDGRQMILLEGNIGAGKTTVGRAAAQSDQLGFIEEPTKMWREGFSSNLLDQFYRDPHRWAFTFQICAFITRAKTWSEVLALTDHSRVLLERSIYCDRYVFAENCYRTGLIEAAEFQLYAGMWDFLVSHYCVEPDMILYLRTPADECMARIRERDRTEEVDMELEYLHQLERLHDEWLLNHPKALVLDGARRWGTEELNEVIEDRLRRA